MMVSCGRWSTIPDFWGSKPSDGRAADQPLVLIRERVIHGAFVTWTDQVVDKSTTRYINMIVMLASKQKVQTTWASDKTINKRSFQTKVLVSLGIQLPSHRSSVEETTALLLCVCPTYACHPLHLARFCYLLPSAWKIHFHQLRP
eukprot:m.133561 g.133561  ORF g.133561 m.133561 type:complete len:145 (-) comp15952_c0_seq4:1446-1880(-)